MCAFCAFVMAPPNTLLVLLLLYMFLLFFSLFSSSFGARMMFVFEDKVSSNSRSCPSFSFLSASMRFFSYVSFAFFFAFSAVDGKYVFCFALATVSYTHLRAHET